MLSSTAASSWYAKLPVPRAVPLQLATSELNALMNEPDRRAGVDYLIVDVRRADMDVGPEKTLEWEDCEVRADIR